MTTELIGWVSAAIRLRRSAARSTDNGATAVLKGISRWPFVGQITASAGFDIYSWLSLGLMPMIARLFSAKFETGNFPACREPDNTR
jgi:hypothetical protein